MAEIAPLTPLRYDLQRLVQKGTGLGSVVAPPYDVISAKDRAELCARDPHNVVRLILPEAEGREGEGDPDAKYRHAARLFTQWRDQGVLVRDNEPAFYRYDQTFLPPGAVTGPSGAASSRAITRRGFLALVRLAPFADRVVLPHERTLSGPKEDRLKLFRATGTNLSPGFMLYRDSQGELDGPLETGHVLADFNTPDGVHHVLAKVTARDALRAIVAKVAQSTLLIADGHHRYETAVRYRDEMDRAATSPLPARAEHRYFMTFLVNGDDPNLVVFPTHRHVHSLPRASFDELLDGARATFEVELLPPGVPADVIEGSLVAGRSRLGEDESKRRPTFAVCAPDGRVAKLTLRSDVSLAGHPTLSQRPEVLRRTDVAVLHDAVLEHLLGITKEAQAEKTNLWYPQDLAGTLVELRGGKGQFLFVMNPTPVHQVRSVAEAGEVMPQKSTFFFPKVLTGLAIHTLRPSEHVAVTL